MLRSVILPAYNEAGYIARMVERTIAALASRPDPFEVIVVDNASSDATPQVVEGMAARDERVRLFRHEENRLYAGSCRTGTSNARGERIFIVDSDGQHPPEDVWKFDAKLGEGYDLVLGWRRRRAEPRGRLIMSGVLLALTRLYLGYPLHDVNCGIRGFSRAYAHALAIRHRVNLVNPELYVRARQGGFRVGEVAVEQESRKAGVSSQDLRRLFRVFLDVNRYLWALRRELAEGAPSR